MKEALPDRLYHALDRCASRLERLPAVLLAGWSFFYFILTIALSKQKLFWDDEFFTLYLSRLPRFSELWTALLTGADQHPPSFYWLTHGVLSSLGASHLSLRLPAMLGFWCMGLCVFVFVSRRTSPLYGIAAAILPALTGAYYYAAEGRGYGLVLGLGGLALVSWQFATEGRGRALALTSLAVSLAAAVGSHYYAVLLLLPLGLGELVRSLSLRRLDLPVWLTFASPAVPLLAFIPVIRADRQYSAGFWARPYWPDALLYYGKVFGSTVAFLTIILVLLGLLMLQKAEPNEPRWVPPGQPAHEIAALLGLIALPLAAMVLAKLVTNAFHPRYALMAVIGWDILLIYVVYAIAHGRVLVGAVLAVLFFGSFVFLWREAFIDASEKRVELQKIVELLQTSGHETLPIVAAEAYLFYTLSYYAPPSIAHRVSYLADPACELQYLSHDTVDRGLLSLKPWTRLNVSPYRTFVHDEPAFLVIGYVGDWSWLTYRLIADGLAPTLVGRTGHRLLLFVDQRGHENHPPAQECGPGRTARTSRAEDPAAELSSGFPITGSS
jgi:hypothetical protein